MNAAAANTIPVTKVLKIQRCLMKYLLELRARRPVRESRCGRLASCRRLPGLQFDDLQSRRSGLNAVGGSVVMPLEASGARPSADCYGQECTLVPVRRQWFAGSKLNAINSYSV